MVIDPTIRIGPAGMVTVRAIRIGPVGMVTVRAIRIGLAATPTGPPSRIGLLIRIGAAVIRIAPTIGTVRVATVTARAIRTGLAGTTIGRPIRIDLVGRTTAPHTGSVHVPRAIDQMAINLPDPTGRHTVIALAARRMARTPPGLGRSVLATGPSPATVRAATEVLTNRDRGQSAMAIVPVALIPPTTAVIRPTEPAAMTGPIVMIVHGARNHALSMIGPATCRGGSPVRRRTRHRTQPATMIGPTSGSAMTSRPAGGHAMPAPVSEQI
jgi:hypothetical protein